ncbi:hypothetical protein CHCC20372_4413 [Bacillus paralicheniformis]|nr:hypothetical protein CHCC20372_4413 [Bacillus paralicheniformis]
MDITLSILLNHYIGTMTYNFQKRKKKALKKLKDLSYPWGP